MGVCFSQERATEQCGAVPSACSFYLAPSPLAIGQELGPEQHGSQARASWRLAQKLEVWTWSLVPRSSLVSGILGAPVIRTVASLGELCGRARIRPKFWGRKSLSGCQAGVWVLQGSRSPGQGRERRILLRQQPDQPQACKDGNSGLVWAGWEVGFQSLSCSSSPWFVLVCGLA